MFSLKEYLHKDPVDFQSNPARIAWVIKTRRNVAKRELETSRELIYTLLIKFID